MEQINLEEVIRKQLMHSLGYSDSEARQTVARYSCTGELADLESTLISHESMVTML